MGHDLPLEELARTIAGLDRDGCLSHLRQIERPRLDFSDDFLAALSVDRLRHVLLAACLQARKYVRKSR